MDKIALLKNPIQDYAWGSRTFIPQLMGEPGPKDKPQAELWMGAHPKTPSQVLFDGDLISLLELIQRDPEGILGQSVAKRFSNKLPFLFKVLAAAKPLSIQAHPNRDQAREGFAQENSLGIPLNASHRNYRDENQKPEMICALTTFWALNGFRKIEDLIALTDRIGTPALRDKTVYFRKQPEAEGLKEFFTTLMTMEKDYQRRMVTEIVNDCEKSPATDPTLEWIMKLNQEYPGDIGVLSPIFMNVVRLRPGQAMYTSTGVLHAYLEGAGVELMANSDNVLRGGLTAKNIDVPELLGILNFTHSKVDILRPERQQGAERIYQTPAEEFMLSVISVGEGSPFESYRERSVEIMICIDGNAHVTNLGSGDVLSLTKGTALIVPAAVEQYRIEGAATIYKATVPI